jgi:hypothetical protein
MNASTLISKQYMDIQIKLEKNKSTKPIDAIDVCKERCKTCLQEVQQIAPSFKLHLVDPADQNQTILHAIKDFREDLMDLKIFSTMQDPI